jgi:hypothetical protein
MNCSTTLSIMYTLILLLVLILVGTVIQAGTSDKKMVSWTLYSFSVIFGLIAIGLLFFLKCVEGAQTSAKKWTIPVLTVTLCLSNMIGMILSKPNLPISQLFTPHFTNVILLIGSILLGMGVCNFSSSANLQSGEESSD